MSEVVDVLQKKDSSTTVLAIDEKLVKIDRAAEITGFKKGYLYELVFKNAIPYVRINRGIRFDPDELERWMRSGIHFFGCRQPKVYYSKQDLQIHFSFQT